MLTRSAASSHHLWRCGHLASWPAAARHLCKLRQLRGTKTAIINIWISTLSTLSTDCVAEDAARHVCRPIPSPAAADTFLPVPSQLPPALLLRATHHSWKRRFHNHREGPYYYQGLFLVESAYYSAFTFKTDTIKTLDRSVS